MDSSPPFESVRRMVYRLRAVQVRRPDGGTFGPVDWMLERGRRVRVACAETAQWEGWVDLLTGRKAPASGAFEEVLPVSVQTDLRVRESINMNRTLGEWLHSPDAPQSVWLEGRRRSVGVLLDRLGITPALTRRALRYESAELLDKVWALRFMVSRAQLLIGREVFRIADPEVRAVFAQRWGDLPGAVVAGESDVPLPGPCDNWVAIDAEGRFSAGADPAAEPNRRAPPDDPAAP